MVVSWLHSCPERSKRTERLRKKSAFLNVFILFTTVFSFSDFRHFSFLQPIEKKILLHYVYVRLNDRVFARDPKGRGFESRPVRFQVTALGKLLTRMCLCHQAV